MRRYDIVSGILLILSIIDFALAAPVPVQEKRQTCVDVVHIPKDVTTVLEKRGDEELEKLAEEFFKTWGRPIDSSESHASSSSAPLGPDHGSTNVVQSPAPNPLAASSTANPSLLMEPSSPSSIAPMSGSFEDPFNAAWDKDKAYSDKGSDTSLEPLFTPGSSGYGSDNELEWATAYATKLNPIRIPGPSPGADPNFDWNHWSTVASPPKPSSPKGFGLVPEHQMGHVQQLDAGPSTGADPDFDWYHWSTVASPPKPSSPKEFGLVPEHQMGHVQQPNAGPPTGADSDFDWGHWTSVDDPLAPAPRPAASTPPKEPENEVIHGPPPTPESTDPELHSDPQSLGTGSQPVDLQAAIYAAKGKAKESRRISGTARTVGNAAQRELQPAESRLIRE